MAKTNFARDQLRSIVERIERLEEEKKALAEDIKEVKAEAKGNGFDVKIINKVLKLRAKDAAERATEEEMIDLYMDACSFEATPLAKAAPKAVPPHPRDPVATEAKQAVEEEATILRAPEVAAEPPHDPETGEVMEEEGATACEITAQPSIATVTIGAETFTAEDARRIHAANVHDMPPIPAFLDRRGVREAAE